MYFTEDGLSHLFLLKSVSKIHIHPFVHPGYLINSPPFKIYSKE